MITSLTVLSMLTNLCLVLLLLFADPFVPKFYFQLTEKSSMFFTVKERAVSTDDSTRYIRTLV